MLKQARQAVISKDILHWDVWSQTFSGAEIFIVIQTISKICKERSFKNFSEDNSQSKLSEANLHEIHHCTNVNDATELLTNKLTVILDELAPIKIFQTCTKYAAWLKDDKKQLKKEREAAQTKAPQTDDPENWRL